MPKTKPPGGLGNAAQLASLELVICARKFHTTLSNVMCIKTRVYPQQPLPVKLVSAFRGFSTETRRQQKIVDRNCSDATLRDVY